MNSKKAALILLSIFACFILYSLYKGYVRRQIDEKVDRIRKTGECFMKGHDIGFALEIVYEYRKKELLRKHLRSRSEADKSEYWWISAVKEYKLIDIDSASDKILYCPFDADRSYISSYISNPTLNITDLSKIKEPDKTILLMERKPFHDGEYFCVLANFKATSIKLKDLRNYKRW